MAEVHSFSSVWVNSEPQMRYLEDGTGVVSFLGGNRPFYKTKDRHEGYEFVIWGTKRAEFFNENIGKGDCLDLFSSSPIQNRHWTGNSGEVEKRMSVRVDNWTWSSGKAKNDESEQQGGLPF